MLSVRARQRRPFRAPPVMDQLTCTRFSGLVRPVLKRGPKSLTVGQVFVRGLYIATGQYSSFCGCALRLMLAVLDIMEVEVQDREQEEEGEKVQARERKEDDKTRTNNARSNM